MSDVASPPPARVGRQPSTSHAELSHIAFRLFVTNGFDATTVDEIAAAAGIGRRTFFRYFASKNDLAWGDFDALLARLRLFLASLPASLPLHDALRIGVVEFNRLPDDEVAYHRQRMELLLNVPTLVAHATLRYAAWRQVIAEFAAARLGVPAESLRPQTIAWACLAASMSAYEHWLRSPDAELGAEIDTAFRVLATTFAPEPEA